MHFKILTVDIITRGKYRSNIINQIHSLTARHSDSIYMCMSIFDFHLNTLILTCTYRLIAIKPVFILQHLFRKSKYTMAMAMAISGEFVHKTISLYKLWFHLLINLLQNSWIWASLKVSHCLPSVVSIWRFYMPFYMPFLDDIQATFVMYHCIIFQDTQVKSSQNSFFRHAYKVLTFIQIAQSWAEEARTGEW